MSKVDESRILKWGLTLTLNIISLICICDATKKERTATDVFAITVTSISMFVAFIFYSQSKIAAFANIEDVLTGSILEMAGAFIIFLLWCFALGFINSENVTIYGVENANLYYSSWGSFLVSLSLLFDICRNFMNKEVELRNPRVPTWSLAAAANFVVMFSAIQVWRGNECRHDREPFCNRSVFATVLGCIGALMAVIMVIVLISLRDGNKIVTIEVILSFFMSLAYTFGVSYITSSDGPGSTIGNLYYFSWISFFTSISLLLNCSAGLINEANKYR